MAVAQLRTSVSRSVVEKHVSSVVGWARAHPTTVSGKRSMGTLRHRRTVVAAVAVALAISCVNTGGCASRESPADTSGDAPGLVSGEARPPAPPALADPEGAVRSYLAWVSYAYLIGDFQVAESVMTADEAVRVDAYIELNRQAGKRIEQQVQALELHRVDSGEVTASATVAGREQWRYRYLSADGRRALTEWYTSSYETTYTLLADDRGRWLVTSVMATPLTEVR